MPAAKRRELRWRRIDVPGREVARIETTAAGTLLAGRLEFDEEGIRTRLAYRVTVDEAWRTRSADVEGRVGDRPVRLALAADGEGRWRRDGAPVPELDGAVDIDLSTTPSTNTLPIRRLALAVGESATVLAAWFRVPELGLEPLEQTYTREADELYRFDALVDGQHFRAHLTTDAEGWVRSYEGLWELDPPDGDAA
ncbi:putative glycolipid-binding domain-containing protein [Naasia sp. SYSU D00057]|uniref:putative glycolipid-binding domain-containing protein n=1 Tax=Naasia sp. SYSU D00057 TaxID=2817380 RepID=UPI001B309081|nr:putative glycolipid-binding domain-containing protein [Naasia sp. SYSU D00057]